MLQAVGIGRRQRDGDWLFRNVTLTLRPGERRSLTGPTGSGKTLLLRALALLDPLDEGRIQWNGRPVSGDDVPRYRSHVVYLHQRPVLIEGTVEDNLRAVWRLGVHRGKQYDRAKIASLLESLGLSGEFLLRPQHVLSGGEQQLVALLRAMQIQPFVLLLDEPTSALDPASTALVERLVGRWHGELPNERALVWVTHDLAQAQRVADGRSWMEGGRLKEHGDG